VEEVARRDDMYLPMREREMRRSERARERRRGRRRRSLESVRLVGRRGDWGVHFVCAEPTIWTAGARPRTYGEPVVSSEASIRRRGFDRSVPRGSYASFT